MKIKLSQNTRVKPKTVELILQPFRHFSYATAHSPTFPSIYLRHSSFFNPSVASYTSQLILQPFFRFTYVTGSSLTSPGEPPMRSRRKWFWPRFQYLWTLCIATFRCVCSTTTTTTTLCEFKLRL